MDLLNIRLGVKGTHTVKSYNTATIYNCSSIIFG